MVFKGFWHAKLISGTILSIVGIFVSLGGGGGKVQGQIEFKRDR